MTKALEPGDKAPNFSLQKGGGGKVAVRDFKGTKLVLYFYPKDDTAGCTREAIDFTRAAKAFDNAGAAVIGVSKDSVASHEKFIAKHDLDVALASDPDNVACRAYGVWTEKKLYGRKYMGIERATFLIDTTGHIARIWRKVKVAGHVKEVLEAARSLAT